MHNKNSLVRVYKFIEWLCVDVTGAGVDAGVRVWSLRGEQRELLVELQLGLDELGQRHHLHATDRHTHSLLMLLHYDNK